MSKTSKKLSTLFVVTLVTMLALLLGGTIFAIDQYLQNEDKESAENKNSETVALAETSFGIDRFASCQDFEQSITDYNLEFADFIDSGVSKQWAGLGGLVLDRISPLEVFSDDLATDLLDPSESFSISERSSNDFSATNNQVSGVDEGDIIKTNGKYIYSLQRRGDYDEGQYLAISQFEDGELSLIATYNLENRFANFTKLNLYQDLLILVYNLSYNETQIEVFDVSETSLQSYKNGQKMTPIRTNTVIGYLRDTRLNNGILYTISDTQRRDVIFLEGDQLPNRTTTLSTNSLQVVSQNDEPIKTDCSRVSYIQPITQTEQLVTVAGINLNDLDQEIETEIILGASDIIYMSPENIYLTQNSWSNWRLFMESDSQPENISTIFKLKLDEAEVKLVNDGQVPGNLLNQFSMDEYEGYLRVATSVDAKTVCLRLLVEIDCDRQDAENKLIILDENMQEVSRIEELGLTERIYAARFMGDRGFIVTFRETDPLYAFDLSDPKNPELKGELKIPGFSNYLHPINQDTLIGVGQDATETGRRQGLKISLFDVSDLENPTEADQIILGDSGTGSLVSNDHKAFLWNPNNQKFSLPVDLYEIKNQNQQTFFGSPTFVGSYTYQVDDLSFDYSGRISHGFRTSNYEDDDFIDLPRIMRPAEEQEEPSADLNQDDQTAATSLPAEPQLNEQNGVPIFITRQMYIGNYLITHSDYKIQVHDYANLDKLVSELDFDVADLPNN